VFSAIAKSHNADPNFAYEYGDTLLRSEGAEAALPYLERATSLIEGRAALGKAYVELGRFSEAIPQLEAAVSADPDLLLPLSRAYKASGRTADADRALSEYKKRQNQN
jgi:predicted Zn-dependent protease